MDSEADERERLVESVCEYPYILSSKAAGRRPASSGKFSTYYGARGFYHGPGQASGASFDCGRPSIHSSSNTENIVTGPAAPRRELRPRGSVAQIGQKKTVVYQATRALGGVMHNIEISTNGKYVAPHDMN